MPAMPDHHAATPPSSLRRRWRDWHVRRPGRRIALKLAAMLVVAFLVLYPKVWLLPREIHRVTHLSELIEPDHPDLAPLEAEVRARLATSTRANGDAAPSPAAVRKAVERVVYEHLPYAFDWQVWGVMEYLPTVGEALAAGREDCDGRAVVAASLLKRMGVDAWLATDLLHMWVETPRGPAMAPTGAPPSLDARKGARFDLSLVTNLARGGSFGVAVFPLAREIVLLVAAILLTLHPRLGWTRLIVGVLLLAGALVTLRVVGDAAARQADARSVALAIIAGVGALVGWVLLAVRSRRAAPSAEETG